MPSRTPDIKVKPGQIWADKDKRSAGRKVQILEVDGIRFAIVQSPTGLGRKSRVQYDHRGLRGYTLVSDPDEQGTAATLAGSIAIEPAAARDDLDRVPETSYVQVSRDGTAIVPSDNAPLSTESVAREVRTLIGALRGFEFNGALIRTAAAKYGSGRSRIDVTDSVVRF